MFIDRARLSSVHVFLTLKDLFKVELMGSQGPGRKRTPSKNGLTAEEDALNVIAREVKSSLKSP